MSKIRCSICAHADAVAINAALESGVSQLTIASQFFASKYALSRHRRNCLSSVPVVTATGSTWGQLDRWLNRADELYLAAGANGDVRSQVAALSAAVRSLQAEMKREEKRQEQAASVKLLPNGETPVTVEAMDALVSRYIDSTPPGTCPICGGKLLHAPDPSLFMPEVAQ